MKTIFRILTIFFTTTITYGQTVTITPPNEANNRFATEYFTSIIRPGLSLNGFDNGGDDSKGLGLKQILNEALTGNTYIINKLNIILNAAKSELKKVNPTQSQIETNSRILQYTAFEALASYVLEQNNIDSIMSRSQGLNIRSHAVAVADLRQKMLFFTDKPASYMVTTRKDYVNNVKSYQNIARAMDLYLALESAYKYWDYAEWNGDTPNFL